MLTLLRWEI